MARSVDGVLAAHRPQGQLVPATPKMGEDRSHDYFGADRSPLRPTRTGHMDDRRCPLPAPGNPLLAGDAPPPGPGTWRIDAVHFPGPATRYGQEMHPEPFMRGFSEFTRFYGMLIGSLEYAYVNRFVYSTMHPAPEAEIPERFARAEEALDKKLWREQLEAWDAKFKPEAIEKHRAIQAIDPETLSDDELIAHLQLCRAHHIAMIYQHMRHTGAAILPVGDLMVHASEWTDIPGGELLAMMRGSSPVSAGASVELQQLVAAFNSDPTARELLESDRDPGEILYALRTYDSDAGRALSAYLDLVGYRLLDGFDISGRYAL